MIHEKNLPLGKKSASVPSRGESFLRSAHGAANQMPTPYRQAQGSCGS